MTSAEIVAILTPLAEFAESVGDTREAEAFRAAAAIVERWGDARVLAEGVDTCARDCPECAKAARRVLEVDGD